MFCKSTLFNIVLALLVACPAYSQPMRLPAPGNSLITFEHIPSPNFGIVNTIIRDDRGFLWFGTTSGLCKYDGYQVRVFPNGPALDDPHQFITAIIKTGIDSLLLGTAKGLWIFNLKTEQYIRCSIDSELSENGITAIVEGSGGTIWIGTTSLGLFGYNVTTGTLQRYTTRNGLIDNKISCLLLDSAGTLWIGGVPGGLTALSTATSHIAHYRKTADAGSLWSDEVTSLCEGDNGELWIGTNEGTNVLDLKHERMRRVNLQSPIPHTVWSMAHDPSGNMWIAASELGLLQVSNGRPMLFETPGDVNRSMSSIRALYLDPVASTRTELLFWIGTRFGINRVLISKNPFSVHLRDQQSLRLNRGAVLSLCEDRKGILWAGLWGGGLEALQRANGQPDRPDPDLSGGRAGRYTRIAHFENAPKDPFTLPNNDVGSVVEDREGNLWIGTAAGLAMLDPQRRRMVIDRHVEGDSTSLVANDVYGVYESRSGIVWIYGRGGLSQLAEETGSTLRKDHIAPHHFKNFFRDPSDARRNEDIVVSSVLEDHLSNLWAGTYGKGLNKLEANGKYTRFTHLGDSSGNQENLIYAFAEDHEGLFWLSTGAGLVSFDPRTHQFRRHEIGHLHKAHIFGIAVDQTGDLWLSMGLGLAKFSPKTGAFVRYDDKDGMPFKELFSGFFQGAHGRLFVGGLDGFAEFSPESVFISSHPPEIAITSFSVFDKELSGSVLAQGETRLSYDQNFFSFSFAALDYANPLRNRFAYRMVGIDNDWVDAGTRNYANYPNLNPSNYVFQVKGCNSDNVWNESGTSISIIITPPYWQTWWFRLFVAAIIVGTTYSAYRNRLRRLLDVERLRLRIADDLHDDVGSNLSTIAMVSRTIQRAPEMTEATRRKLAEIYDTAVTTSEGMKDIVWFIKPKNDTLDDLLLRMKDTASSLLSDVQHDFQAPKNESTTRIAIDFKRNFFLGFKEILTNIMKHASATNVQIQVNQHDGALEMVVQDNGHGFDPPKEEAVQHGNGLASLRSRARAIGGVCEIISQRGKGTSVKFSGKL